MIRSASGAASGGVLAELLFTLAAGRAPVLSFLSLTKVRGVLLPIGASSRFVVGAGTSVGGPGIITGEREPGYSLYESTVKQRLRGEKCQDRNIFAPSRSNYECPLAVGQHNSWKGNIRCWRAGPKHACFRSPPIPFGVLADVLHIDWCSLGHLLYSHIDMECIGLGKYSLFADAVPGYRKGIWKCGRARSEGKITYQYQVGTSLLFYGITIQAISISA